MRYRFFLKTFVNCHELAFAANLIILAFGRSEDGHFSVLQLYFHWLFCSFSTARALNHASLLILMTGQKKPPAGARGF